MKIAVASSSWVGIRTLQHLQRTTDVIGVITSPDKPAGRGRELKPNAFSHYAAEQGLRIYQPSSHQELHQSLMELKADIVVTIAYGRLIKSAELAIPKFGWLNVHFSLLPRWRGAAPVQYAIWNGDKETGVTVFKLDEGLDTGPVYSMRKLEIANEDNTETLLEKLTGVADSAIDEALEKIIQGVPPIPQTSEMHTLAPKISKTQGKIDWHSSSIEIARQIRALHPWPGCWSTFAQQRVQICQARPSESILDNGHYVGSIQHGEKISVKCGTGSLELLTVKPEGKREMTAEEWARGIHDKSLRFES